jgi:hypothetical protein
MQSSKWTNHPNLRLSPLCPAAARGRLQRQVRHVGGTPIIASAPTVKAPIVQGLTEAMRLSRAYHITVETQVNSIEARPSAGPHYAISERSGIGF